MDAKPSMEPRPFIRTPLPELTKQIEAKKMNPADQAAKIARANALYGMLSSPNRLGLDKTQQETIMIGANRAGAEAAKKVETELAESPVELVDRALHETASEIAAAGNPREEQWISVLERGSKSLRSWEADMRRQLNLELVNLNSGNPTATIEDAYDSLLKSNKLSHRCLIMDGLPPKFFDQVMKRLDAYPKGVTGIDVLKQTNMWDNSVPPFHLKHTLKTKIPDITVDANEHHQDNSRTGGWIWGNKSSIVKIAQMPEVDSLFVRQKLDMSKFYLVTASKSAVPTAA